MAAADPNAGLIYVCNPNNPTGTLTSRADLEWLVANKPAGCVVMIDEAYIQIAGAQPVTDLVAADQDLVVLRRFSKIASATPGGLPVRRRMPSCPTSVHARDVPERRKVYIGRVWPSWPTCAVDERVAPDRRNYRAQVKRPPEPVPQPAIAKPETVRSTFFD
jgi:hypothetical protein